MTTQWFCYIVRCKDQSLYCGITTDVVRRVHEHDQGNGSKYTRSRRPVRLVCVEVFSNRSEASKREAEVKAWSKCNKEQLVKDWLNKQTAAVFGDEQSVFERRGE